MDSLTKAAILAAEDLTRERVDVPEWGGSVWLAVMSGAVRDAFEAGLQNGSGSVNLHMVRARLLVKVLVDDAGARLFTEEDIATLAQKSGAVLDRLFERASRLNHLSRGDVETLAKN